MTVNVDIAMEIAKIIDLLERDFWRDVAFWIDTSFNMAGLVLSGLAFWAASRAHAAAVEAGRTVKGQSVAIELSEIAQRLDSIQPEITYRDARDMLSEISRRVRRVISPFADDSLLKSSVETLRVTLQNAQDSLKLVRPADSTSETKAPDAVYFGIENEFSAINNAIADFLGLLEKKTIEKGNANAG